MKPKKIWVLGKKLFHGKFLAFMRGPANRGTARSGDEERGSYDPQRGSINFAVPKVLSSMENSRIPDKVMPGIMTDMIDYYIDTDPEALTRSHNLCLDLKKINANKKM